MGTHRPLPPRPPWRRAPTGAIGLLILLLAPGVGACDPASAPFSGERCEGVPHDHCQDAIDEAADAAGARDAVIIGVRVRCTSAVCTDQQGDIAVEAWLSDGSEYESSGGYATPVGTPPDGLPPGGQTGGPTPIPLEPVCLGVPRAWCIEQAAAALEPDRGPGSAPVSVVVRCTRSSCTETTGGGSAVVTYEDGGRSEIDFEYNGDIPSAIPVASPAAPGSDGPGPDASP